MDKNTGSVAVVDDEENIRETVAYALRREGYHVDLYTDGQHAWERLENALPDLCVLDILMPRMDGLELCRKLRGQSEMLPIIFLTSKDEEFDRVLGLELGADDYLCKPFAMRELVARIKVLFRRLALAGAGAATAPEETFEPRTARARYGALSSDVERRASHTHRHRVHAAPCPRAPARPRQVAGPAHGRVLPARRLCQRADDRQPREETSQEVRPNR